MAAADSSGPVRLQGPKPASVRGKATKFPSVTFQFDSAPAADATPVPTTAAAVVRGVKVGPPAASTRQSSSLSSMLFPRAANSACRFSTDPHQGGVASGSPRAFRGLPEYW